MKARPRSVEREVALCLSEKFLELGMSPVVRIPVLGRTGPDLTINESGLAIDVKSRKEIPKGIFLSRKNKLNRFDGMVAVYLADFPILFDLPRSKDLDFSSKLVSDYLAHMADWDELGNNIPAVVLHRPGMWIANAIFVMYEIDLPRLRLKKETKWQDEHLMKSSP